MNKRLRKYLDEEARTEKKIAELQEHLRDVRAARKQEENDAIVRSIRSMKLEKHELLELLDGIQSGEVDMLRTEDFLDEEDGSMDAPEDMTGADGITDNDDYDAPESEARYDGQTIE